MSKFLYYAPKAKAANGEALTTAGIADRFDKPAAGRELTRGPDGAAGVLVGAEAEGLEYRPADQQWQRIHGAGGWVGFTKGDPPGPEDLVRATRVAGRTIPLGDPETHWLIPVGRIYPEGTAFPETLTLGDTGQLVKLALPRYTDLCAQAERIWSLFVQENAEDMAPESPAKPIEDAEAFDLACRILAVNYRLGPTEVSILRLLDTHTTRMVLFWFVDAPAWIEAERARLEGSKKNGDADTPPGPASSSGEAGS